MVEQATSTEDENVVRQCPHCGSVPEDWSSIGTRVNSAAFTKTRQRKDSEDRTLSYRKWRWEFGNGCYVNDIDQVEWRVVDGKPTPVGVLEISRVDGNVEVPDSYLNAVLDRFKKRDSQAQIILNLANSIGVKVWVSLFRYDLTEFWVYNLTNDRGWFHLNQSGYKKWIMDLKPEITSKTEEEGPIPS